MCITVSKVAKEEYIGKGDCMKHSNKNNEKRTDEVKQAFLSSAISDLATWIQFSDTKVSIIMGAFVALIAGTLACYDPIYRAMASIEPCSWIGISMLIAILALLISCVCIFLFGIMTIQGHDSIINYKSKWFWGKGTKEYSFDAYKHDLNQMTDKDIIENMGAELYKLNDINRQKSKTMKWTIRSFATALVSAGVIGMLFLISSL